MPNSICACILPHAHWKSPEKAWILHHHWHLQLLIYFPGISKLILGQHIMKNALHQCYHLILMCLVISANLLLHDVTWWTSIWFAIFPLSLIWFDALQCPSSMHPTLLWWIYWPNWLDCLPCTIVKPVQKNTYIRRPLI